MNGALSERSQRYYMAYSPDDKERLNSYLNIHLKKQQRNLPPDQKIEALQKRDRNMWFRLLLNIVIILLFGYSYYYGITNLGATILIILLVIFLLNVAMIFYQKKQIKELIQYISQQNIEGEL